MTDVFVVGGGPAGLAAAIALSRKGMSVTLCESRRPPVDKTCGEGVLPEGVAAASLLGVDLIAAGSCAVHGIRLSGDGVSVQATFPKRPGCGIRRTVLHRLLLERAVQCGVRILWGQSVGNFEDIQARWIVGADGAASRVRQWAGLGSFVTNRRRFGFTLHFEVAPWTEYIEGHYGDGLQLFVTPLSTNETGVAVLSRDPKLRIAEALDRFPAVREKIGEASVISAERGAVTVSLQLKRVTRGNIALAGDASGSVDAITAEGLSLSFRQAIALADALEHNDLAAYEGEHRTLARRPRFMAEFMLMMDRSSWIRRHALTAMAAHPALFGNLLAMHVGESGTPAFARACAVLGWRMVTG